MLLPFSLLLGSRLHLRPVHLRQPEPAGIYLVAIAQSGGGTIHHRTYSRPDGETHLHSGINQRISLRLYAFQSGKNLQCAERGSVRQVRPDRHSLRACQSDGTISVQRLPFGYQHRPRIRSDHTGMAQSYSDNLTWSKGTHVLKSGGEIRIVHTTEFEPQAPRGNSSSMTRVSQWNVSFANRVSMP